MKHQHTDFEIITMYFKDRPAQITSARCSVCKEESPELIQMAQEREIQAFELFGNEPPVVWMGDEPSRTMWKQYPAEELKIKGLLENPN